MMMMMIIAYLAWVYGGVGCTVPGHKAYHHRFRVISWRGRDLVETSIPIIYKDINIVNYNMSRLIKVVLVDEPAGMYYQST